jgi:hypothetical protein
MSDDVHSSKVCSLRTRSMDWLVGLCRGTRHFGNSLIDRCSSATDNAHSSEDIVEELTVPVEYVGGRGVIVPRHLPRDQSLSKTDVFPRTGVRTDQRTRLWRSENQKSVPNAAF